MLRGYVPDGQGTGGYSVSGGVALSTLVTGLVAYWSLDEASGTRADSVGSNDLTDNNTVGAAAGKNNNAASFVATNNESLSVDEFAGLDSIKAVSLWLKIAAGAGGGNYPLIIGRATASRGMEMYDNGDNGRITCRFRDVGGNASDALIETVVVADNNWHNLIMTFTDADRKTRGYLDNSETGFVQGDAVPSATLFDSSAPLNVGGWAFGYLNGLIDEIGIWSRVLTSDERAELYAAGAGVFYPFT